MSIKTLFTVAVLSTLTAIPALAATQDIAVTNAGDSVYYREWWRGGSDRGWIADANPNVVAHSYYDGSGSSRGTALNFDLGSLSAVPADILTVTLNFKVLDVWTEGRDDIGNISNGLGTIFASGGSGWKSFDVTSFVKDALPSRAAGFYIDYTGYSGFTFGSAEGGQPAFLRFTTAAVPEPEAIGLLLAGLGVVGIKLARRKA